MKVLIGVDDSPYSDAAIGHVTGAAWPKATKFIVLSAVAPIFLEPGEAVAGDAISRLMEQQEKYHMEIAERAATRLRNAGLSAEARMVVGDPRAALIDAARSEHSDLVIVGSHGRTGIKKFLLGSVASHVVRTHLAAFSSSGSRDPNLAEPGVVRATPAATIPVRLKTRGAMMAAVFRPDSDAGPSNQEGDQP
jgi:nucleotide-binding universal stress UspA family protein